LSVLAADVGGTKIAAALLDDQGGVLRRVEQPTIVDDTEAMWGQLVGSFDELAGPERALTGIAVSCGGPMRWPEGEVSPLNIPGWRGFPVRARLAERYRLPVRVHNDAVCLAVGEHWRGAGRGTANLLGMVVSTGVGGGLVLAGRVYQGASGNAGHVGHLVVDPQQGPRCGCGGDGCVEAIARGPAVAAWAVEHGWAPGPGADGTARALATDAAAGHPVALAALARAGQALGVAIASAVNLLDLDLVVVGGGVARAGRLMFDPLRAAFDRHARLGLADSGRIVPAALGADAGLVGAAALLLAGDRYWTAN
jgi:glucokinase